MKQLNKYEYKHELLYPQEERETWDVVKKMDVVQQLLDETERNVGDFLYPINENIRNEMRDETITLEKL